MGSNSTFLSPLCEPVSRFWADIDNPSRGYDEIDLTLCFQDTVILSGSCLVFILSFLFQVLYFRKTSFRIQVNFRNVSKLLLVGILTAVSLTELIYSAIFLVLYPGELAPFQIYSPAISCVSFIFCLILIHYHRTRGIYTAGVFHVFWAVLIIHDVIKIRTYALEVESGRTLTTRLDYFYLIISCVNLLIRSILLELTLIPDLIPESWFKGIENPIPEERATFLSQITWWWLNGLIWRGYRRTLDRTDLWSLPRAETATCASAFRDTWENEYKHKLDKLAKKYSTEDVLMKTIRNAGYCGRIDLERS